MRLDNIKKQYQHELIPLTQQREKLIREITDLKSAREHFLEETTVLNARNEELAHLSTQYSRRMEVTRHDMPPPPDVPPVKPEPMLREKKSTSFDRVRPTQESLHPVHPSLSTGSNHSTSTIVDDREIKVIRVPKPDFTDAMPISKHGIFKRSGHRMKDQTSKGKGHFEHNFQPANALRFTRCDHCGDKLWGGSHFRCTSELFWCARLWQYRSAIT
jgi:regulator of replication initiation timing